MTKLIAIFTLSVLSFGSLQAQEKITESRLVGTWKMVIDADKVMAKIDKEAKDSETMLAEIILKSVSGMVEGIMEGLQIYVEFKRGGDASLLIEVFESETEDEDTRWYIRNGKVHLDDTNNDNITWDGDDGWYLQDGVLFLDQDDDEDAPVVYMVRIDD